jgi:hypothetical protein
MENNCTKDYLQNARSCYAPTSSSQISPGIWLVSGVSFLSLLASTINIAVFSNRQFKDTLFVYLKLESLLMGVNSAITALSPLYDPAKSATLPRSLLACVYQLYGKTYLASVLEMSALLASICATIICLSLVNQKNKRIFHLAVQLNPYLVILVELVLSALLFIYQLFSSQIVQASDGYYYLISTSFTVSQLNYVLVYVTFYIRDTFMVALLTLLNVYMTFEVRKCLKNKVKLAGSADASGAKTVVIKQYQKKLTKMMIVDSSTLILSRLIIFVYFVLKNINPNIKSKYTICLVYLLPPLSNGIKFFIFFHFNKLFRNVLKAGLARCLFCFFRRKLIKTNAVVVTPFGFTTTNEKDGHLKH